MKWFRENKIIKFVWLVLALHILNASIDPPDTNPESVPEDLSFNDIETITELLAEKILNIEDAMPEHDEHDSEDGSSMESKKVCEFFEKRFASISLRKAVSMLKEYNIYYINHYSFEYSAEVNMPPEMA